MAAPAPLVPSSADYVTVHRPNNPASDFPYVHNPADPTPWKLPTQQARIITFFQQKGGVGKTTCSFSTAYGLARAGHSVLYVDADNQCNGLQAALGKHVAHNYSGDWTHFFATVQLNDTLLTTLR
ncbi:hypothetical protein WJX74_007828 [Apatococcus lobatus]|uniref:AAA domain-containing protein n=1 Tax=Apatococcus lobatus TaxID=904363 RepID=A0AAW1Q991_9CHLO